MDTDGMGPTVCRNESAKPSTPPLKNGNELRESGYLIAVGSRTARFRRKHKSKLSVICFFFLFISLLCLAITMTVLYVKQKKHKQVRVCESKECLRSAANLAISMDRSADPCDDFYQYVCGKWSEEHPRPDAYRSYDWFRDKQTKVYNMVRDFLNKNSTHHPKPVQQARDMYTACMNTDKLDSRGIKPILDVLQAVGLPPYPTYTNISEDFDYSTYSFDWLKVVTNIKTYLGMDVFIGFDIFSDPKNSSVYRLVMGSPETTNPFPSMYAERKKHSHRRHFLHQISVKSKQNEGDENSDSDHKRKEVLILFYAQVIKVFILDDPEFKVSNLSDTTLDQMVLATATEYYSTYSDFYEMEAFNETDSEDYNALIPEYTVSQLQEITDKVVETNEGTPVLIWKEYLDNVFSVSDVQVNYETEKILVSDLDLKYMALMSTYIAKQPPAKIELYLWVKVVEVLSTHTTSELRVLFQKAYEEMQEKKPSDSGSPSRSLQCASAVNDMLGMAVSYAIVDPYFLNVTKPKVQLMLNEMKNALAKLIGQAKWMDDNTKIATYEKIIEMRSLVGFPDWLLEEGRIEDYYQGILIDVDKHLENMISVIQIRIRTVLNKFQKVNNYSWATDPTEVNAYHSFQENTIIPLITALWEQLSDTK